MHVQDVVDGNRFSGGLSASSTASISRSNVLFAEPAQGELCFFGVAVTDHRRDKIAGVAFATGNHQHPHVGFARKDMDVVGLETAMADATALHAIENDALDLLFRGIHDPSLS